MSKYHKVLTWYFWLSLSGFLETPAREVGSIETWGPLFRISFDLIIYSKPPLSGSETVYKIIQFKADAATSDCCNLGARVPLLQHYVDAPERLHFATAIGGDGNYWRDYNINTELNEKYNFVMEQQYVNNEVYYGTHPFEQNIIIFNRFILLRRLMGERSSVTWTQPQDHFKMWKSLWETTLPRRLMPPTATWCGRTLKAVE